MNFPLLYTHLLSSIGFQSQSSYPPPQLIRGLPLIPLQSQVSPQGAFPQTQLSCGMTPNFGQQMSTRIVGGRPSSAGEFPWQVSIQRVSFRSSQATHFCGGSLIDARWVITAAHCMEWTSSWRFIIMKAENEVRVRIGPLDLNSPLSRYFRVRRIIIHPNFNSKKATNDLALLQLEEPINFMITRELSVNSVCLPLKGQRFIGTVTTSGWGTISEEGPNSYQLLAVDVPIISDKQCRKSYQRSYVPEIMLCAGETGKDSCQGDSGGGLIQRDQSGRAVLVGIVSVGNGCGREGYPGIYTRVSSFTDWIINTMR